MQFTPQQLAGAGRYSHKTRIGNWCEDLAIEEVKLNDFMAFLDEPYTEIPLSPTIALVELKYIKTPVWSQAVAVRCEFIRFVKPWFVGS